MLDRAEVAARGSHFLSLLFTEWTGVGVVLAVLLWLGCHRFRSPWRQEQLLLAASLGVLAWFVSIPLAVLFLLYAVAFYLAVEYCGRRWPAVAVVIAILAAMVVVPVIVPGSLGEFGRHARPFIAFSTNMVVLRFYGYAWDRWRGRMAAEPFRRFLLAMFFFPTFVNGPVETPRQLQSNWLPPEERHLGSGLGRVAVGIAKIAFAAVVFPAGWTDGLRVAVDAPALTLWLWAVRLYVWFYISFSGWSDVGVGLGHLAGRRVQENFESPWAATDPADFWRRWHLSLGIWLRDYVYIPLGGGRRNREVNILITFLVSALWHIWGGAKLLGLGYFGPRAWGGFLLWGVLNAGGVIAARQMGRVVKAGGSWGRAGGRIATFLFAAFCWMPFFLPVGMSLATFCTMLARMIWP